MKKLFNLIWKEFIYGGHSQCLGAVGIVYISSFLLDIKVDSGILLATYLIFYPIYINDRFKWIQLDRLTNPERTKHFETYLSLMPKLILLSILFLLILLIYIGNFKFSIFALLLLIFGLLYPLYFKNLTKQIIAFKDFYVAMFFTAIAAASVIYYSYPLSTLMTVSLVGLMLLVFLKTVLMQILLDCKDIESDKSLGLLTIPLLIGKEKTLSFLKISNASITTLILLIAVFFRLFPIRMLILLFTIPFNFYSYNLTQKGNYFGYLLGSGEFLFWLILVLFFKIIAL